MAKPLILVKLHLHENAFYWGLGGSVGMAHD